MLTKELVLKALENVVDPEIGLNLVELGLVYDIQITGEDIYVKMTLTTRGCPLHGSITTGAENAIRTIPFVKNVTVELVWEPVWTPERMTESARFKLGI
ncbi:MAG TPA: metal-sulfur cluster assembly factor [bacterium]